MKTRDLILKLCAFEPQTVRGLADELLVTEQAVSQWLAKLERGGHVIRSGTRRRTGARGKAAALWVLA